RGSVGRLRRELLDERNEVAQVGAERRAGELEPQARLGRRVAALLPGLREELERLAGVAGRGLDSGAEERDEELLVGAAGVERGERLGRLRGARGIHPEVALHEAHERL